MLAMANLPDFAKHREKGISPKCLSIAPTATQPKTVSTLYQDHLSAMQYEGVAMASTVPVAPVISMFTSLKWMRFARDFWELCPKAIVQKFSAWPEG